MLVAGLAALVALVHPGLPANGHEAAPTRAALVQLKAAAACREAVTVVRAGGVPVAPELRLFRLPLSASEVLARGLRARDALQTLTIDRPVGRLATTQTPDPRSAEEWWRAAIGVVGLTPPGPGVPVTVVDSGIDLSHPEFAGRPNTVTLNAQEPAPVGGRHGTAVASLIGAPENGVGMVGIYPQAVIRSWDASLGEGRTLQTSDIVAGIMAAARGGPGVINLSLGSTERDSVIEQAVGRAWASGSLVVAAAGNDGSVGPLTYPASLPHVLTVAATSQDGTIARFSSASRFVDVVAPGDGVLVAGYPVGGWESQGGTSFAAPLVSGAAAWIWTVRPDLDNAQVFEIVRRSARDIDRPGRDATSGFGVLDVSRALSWPATVRDPLEPNEDVDYVKPGGSFSNGLAPLTARGHERGSLTARLDYAEDPRDVYRVWLPAQRSVRVTLRSTVDLDLAVWGPSTISVDQSPRRGRLAASAKQGTGSEGFVVKASPRGRWAYAVVSPARGVVEASYALSVVPSAGARR